jgi:hypothetical protein
MKEPFRLMAVERDVGRIQIEHDLLWRRGVRFHKKVRQQPVQGFGRVADLVITQAAAGQLQTVQRALAGQRFIQFPLAAQQPQQRIIAQLLVIVQVFVAQRQTIDALRKHFRDLVRDQPRRAPIAETARHPAQQLDPAVRLPKQ